MTREEYNLKIDDVHIDEQGCEEAFYLYEIASIEYIYSLESKIKAQEIIIKDKTAFMEAMAQPKVVYTDFKKVNLAKSMGFIK